MANLECRRCGCEIDVTKDKVTKIGYVSMIAGKLDSVEQGEMILCEDCSYDYFRFTNCFVYGDYVIMGAGDQDVEE